MLSITPKELSGKIKHWENDIYVKDGVELTPEEKVIFDNYREHLKQAHDDMYSIT